MASNRDIQFYNVDPRIRMISEAIASRDPRLRAKNNEMQVLQSENGQAKAENERLKQRVAFLENELKRLRKERNGREEPYRKWERNPAESKALLDQISQLQMSLKGAAMENNFLKSRISELIDANRTLHDQLRAKHNTSLVQVSNTSITNQSLNLTSSAVRFAVDEYRRNFEAREKELESKISQWQEKADHATAEINSLRNQLQIFKENDYSRSKRSIDAVSPGPADQYGILPFKKRLNIRGNTE